MIKKVSAINSSNFKSQLIKLIEKHGEATIIFSHCDGLRKRIIKKDGSCEVSYKGTGYRKWSGFEESCFMYYTETQYRCTYRNYGQMQRSEIKGKRKTVKNTIAALIKHDKDEGIIALQINYGKNTNKKTLLIINE